MNKVVIAMIGVIIIIVAMLTAFIIVSYNNTNNEQQKQIIQLAHENEQIIDDCTDEYEELKNVQTLKVNSEEQKISPNCIIKLEKNYIKCGHIINEYIELDENLVNKGKSELKEKYPNWQIQKYTSTEIILTKEYQGECGQHYMIREKDGKIVVNRIIETDEKECQVTDISTEYLDQEEKEKLKNGIKIIGKRNLNEYLENYE